MSISKTNLKKEKDIFKDLDKLYEKNKDTIISWLSNSVHSDNKITGLLNNTKMQIMTSGEYTNYNLILKWFINNKDKFKEYSSLFDRIPSTSFTDISAAIMETKSPKKNSPMAATLNPKTSQLDIMDALKKWKENPNKDPYDGSDIKISVVHTSKYGILYKKFCDYLVTTLDITNKTDSELQDIFEKIRNQLPTSHIFVFKNIDYIQNLKKLYTGDDNNTMWVDYLITKKDIIYSDEEILNIKGSTVYDHLFMHYFFFKNEEILDETTKNNVYDQLFLYETIQEQIKLIKASDLDCYEIFKSMLEFTSVNNPGLNFNKQKIKNGTTEWPYKLPPLLNLFIQYINDLTYYILPMSNLTKIIFDRHFLFGPGSRLVVIRNNRDYRQFTEEFHFEYTKKSIEYNKYRFKTILNIIFGSFYDKDNKANINIKNFLNLLWKYTAESIFECHRWNNAQANYNSNMKLSIIFNNISEWVNEDDYENKTTIQQYKMFLVSALFDIETMFIEGATTKEEKYESIPDPYLNIPEPPEIPEPPFISKELKKYKMSLDKTKDKDKEIELKEYEEKQNRYKKEMKSYDKDLEKYNKKYLDKHLSPYFSVKLERTTSLINNKSKLKYDYSPVKVTAKSLTKFDKSKSKSRKSISKTDLKLKLALESDNLQRKINLKFDKSRSKSKSPRQKYIGCDLNDADPLTREEFRDMHYKKIKYLSKIKTINPDGSIIINCYDTIPLYNYILGCINEGKEPHNIALGRIPFTLEQLQEVYKKIKFFTKKPTLGKNIDCDNKIFLKTQYYELDEDDDTDYYNLSHKLYSLNAHLSIGTINFPITQDNEVYDYIKLSLFHGVDIEKDNLTKKTISLINKGIENGRLLKVTTYPYWHENFKLKVQNDDKLLSLPQFTHSHNDSLDNLIEKTNRFNRSLQDIVE